jgi:hypothetical protein
MAGKIIFIAGAAAILTLGYLGWKYTARSAYETAEYEVLEADGSFEIRQYPDLALATTEMQFDAQGNDGSFMRLFKYISGANDREEKIAMTTPVFMEPESASGGQGGQMGFVLPKQVADRAIPEPHAESVAIEKRAGGKFAVIRFAGRLNTTTSSDAEEKLRAWIGDRGLVAAQAAEFAGYDPPWTPGPLRRNEVLIRLK